MVSVDVKRHVYLLTKLQRSLFFNSDRVTQHFRVDDHDHITEIPGKPARTTAAVVVLLSLSLLLLHRRQAAGSFIA